jgi:hypothetical protein
VKTAARATLIRALAWGSVLGIAAILLALTGYTSRDPDSTIYSQMSDRMAAAPIRDWIAPEWGGAWGLTGRFREHPIGIFILPALLARTGYPGDQAALAIGAAFSIASLLLLGHVAALVVSDEEAVAIQWAALVLPVAFVYRIRANQEYVVLALTLLALYGTQRSRRSGAWIWVVIGATCGVALVKGIFVVFVPIVCAIWLRFVRERPSAGLNDSPRIHDAIAWSALASAIGAVVLLAAAYEWIYRRATGDSFLWFYLRNRVAGNAGVSSTMTFDPATKLYNLAWYSLRVLWFALPGSLVVAGAARRFTDASAESRRAVLFVLLAAATYVATMSLGANKAERFIFPVYFLIAALGTVVAVREWSGVDRVARRLAALPPYSLPAAWLALFVLTLAIARYLPYVKL